MAVWMCVPSARPDGGTLHEWKARGYKLAVWRNVGSPAVPFCDHVVMMDYPGYAKAVNYCVKLAAGFDPSCEWFVTGGDDVSPDLAHSPEEIAAQCTSHFEMVHWAHKINGPFANGAFGVMQPTGDRWGADEPWAKKNWPDAPAYIDRICGSPWMGREFCRRANAGKGPLCEEYLHMHVDEHLQEYAKHLGILWQRQDLIHHHHHALRGKGASMAELPPHLVKWYGKAHWNESKAILDRHQAAGFAGLEPIA